MFSPKQRWLLIGATSISLLIVVATLIYVKIDSNRFVEDLASLPSSPAEPVVPAPTVDTLPPVIPTNSEQAPDTSPSSKSELDEDIVSSIPTSESNDDSQQRQDKVSEARRQIAEMLDDPEIDASEPQTHQTIRDLWRESGLSEAELEEAMAFLPLDPNISLDDTGALLANMQSVVDTIDAHIRTSMADVTLDEARHLVTLFKTEVLLDDEDFRYVTRELFPPNIQQALIAEGVL